MPAPRPYWVSPGVEPFSVEHTFGAPSAHAQNSAALWGTVAAWINKPWAWVTAIVVAVLVGISRLYLGMHFVHDVVIGWLIGYVLLFLFAKFWDPAAAWLRSKTLSQQILIAFVLSLFIIGAGLLSHLSLNDYTFPAEWEANALRAGSLPTPDSVENLFTSAGTLFGLAAGLAWTVSRGGYETSGSVEQRALRYVIGLIGVMIFWEGLGAVFPRGDEWIPLLLRYIRYTLGGDLDRRRRALVVLSFQISKETQDVGHLSVIIPGLGTIYGRTCRSMTLERGAFITQTLSHCRNPRTGRDGVRL